MNICFKIFRIQLPKRSESDKVRSYFISKGAQVIKGRDWKYGNQNGM